MSLAEEIKRVLTENPNILVEVLVSRPEIIYQALAKLTPWQELATKRDIEEIKRGMATKEEIEEVKKDIEAVKRDVDEIKKGMVTKERLEEVEKRMVTKDELEEIRKVMATKDELEEIKKRMATKEDIEEIKRVMVTKGELEEVKKIMATKDELEEIKKVMVTKDELEEVKKVMATKNELEEMKRDMEEMKKIMATKDDIKALQVSISALGARWGVVAEDAFRKGLVDLLAETGWNASREVLFDREGYVYGYPSDIEIDVVVRDGKVIMVELTASLKRGEIIPLVKKRELYEKLKGVKVSEIVVVTPFVDDRDPERLIAVAKSLGIRVVTPLELIEQ